jgi:HD-GYP domain-containing protein (c-di-GMP phosphodiesterase class II)
MRKLSPKELEVGMITAAPVTTPLGQEIAPEGTAITRQLINRMKLYRVEAAYIEGDAPTEPAAPSASAEATPKPAPKSEPKTRVEESMTHFQKVASSDKFRTFQLQYLQVTQQLHPIFQDAAEKNTPIDTDSLLESVAQLFRSRSTIVEVFDMIYSMRSVADPAYAHCLNVSLISRMIGRWLKFDRHDLDTLTIAGLLHDIGKIRIPEEILNKTGKLTDEEFALLRQHPQFGYDILKDQPNLDPRIKKGALMHHERSDGSGYPSNLTEDSIDNFAMIIAIADVYDAMTATRAYRAPLCPFQVISNFEQDGYQKFNTKYILTFLKQIAQAYQNNRVMLSDGRACNIVMLNQNALSRPIVQFDDNSCLDLSTADKDLHITSVL